MEDSSQKLKERLPHTFRALHFETIPGTNVGSLIASIVPAPKPNQPASGHRTAQDCQRDSASRSYDRFQNLQWIPSASVAPHQTFPRVFVDSEVRRKCNPKYLEESKSFILKIFCEQERRWASRKQKTVDPNQDPGIVYCTV